MKPTADSRALEIIYDGYHKFMVEKKHWPCPSKSEIEWWEKFKSMVFDGLEAKHEIRRKEKRSKKEVGG